MLYFTHLTYLILLLQQALIYQKILRLWGGSSGQDHLAIGRLMNLVSVDAKCIYVSYTWCEVWAAPLRVSVL